MALIKLTKKASKMFSLICNYSFLPFLSHSIAHCLSLSSFCFTLSACFSCQASNNLSPHPHPCITFYPAQFLPSLSSSLAHSHWLPDGVIPVILSHYRSSNANGCTANPAAGRPGPEPAPALSGSATAVSCSFMPTIDPGSQLQSSQASGGRAGC